MTPQPLPGWIAAGHPSLPWPPPPPDTQELPGAAAAAPVAQGRGFPEQVSQSSITFGREGIERHPPQHCVSAWGISGYCELGSYPPPPWGPENLVLGRIKCLHFHWWKRSAQPTGSPRLFNWKASTLLEEREVSIFFLLAKCSCDALCCLEKESLRTVPENCMVRNNLENVPWAAYEEPDFENTPCARKEGCGSF